MKAKRVMAAHVNKTVFKKSKNRKHKIELIFDEDKRRDFLSGFRKRKLERKKKAQEKLAQELKEEKKKLKKEARESYKKMVASHRSIPELENLLTEEYEKDDATVKVTELSTSEIANKNNWIGENKPVYEDESDISEPVSENENEENIPGMELKPKIERKEKIEAAKPQYKTKKEIKKALRIQAAKKVQKSKAFQIKNKMEQQKNRRKSIKSQKDEERLKKKGKKQNNKFKRSRNK